MWHVSGVVMLMMTGLFQVGVAREWRCGGDDDWFVLGLCGT